MRLSLCAIHFPEQIKVMMVRSAEMRMLVFCYTGRWEKDFPMPPHQRLRLGEAVGGLEQSRLISSPDLPPEIS
jgi:hypothetical protein